jgi:archaellum component FlaC
MKLDRGSRPNFLFLLSAIFSKSSKSENNEGEGDLEEILDVLEEEEQDRDKINNIEGSITDLKDQFESLNMSNRTVKTEINTMRDDLSEVARSLKDLLCVYEEVSKEYNPFVDPKPTGKVVDDPIPKRERKVYDENTIIPARGSNGIPDDELIKVNQIMQDNQGDPRYGGAVYDNEPPRYTSDPRQHHSHSQYENRPNERVAPSATEPNIDDTDISIMIQFHRLIQSQMEKMIILRSRGIFIDKNEMQKLDYWVSEFKRAGMK